METNSTIYQLYKESTDIKSLIQNAKNIKEIEDIISDNTNLSHIYAKYIINGRFEKGEDAISTNAEYSYLYAMLLVKMYISHIFMLGM